MVVLSEESKEILQKRWMELNEESLVLLRDINELKERQDAVHYLMNKIMTDLYGEIK